MVPKADIVSHSQYPWKVILRKRRVACTKKGCYVEVGVTASRFFVGGLISHLWKILKSVVSWFISFSFHRSVFLCLS
jgi:hypothetical protein